MDDKDNERDTSNGDSNKKIDYDNIDNNVVNNDDKFVNLDNNSDSNDDYCDRDIIDESNDTISHEEDSSYCNYCKTDFILILKLMKMISIII